MKLAIVTAGRRIDFRKRLLAWFRRRQRALPFRGECDSYRIWVSEVMLQQTRVAAALPFYQRFLKRFPTVRALARARQQEVLRLWAGLGYYSRARNLHAAAKLIVSRHGGKFPASLDAALSLPGVGRYTAAAVLSIAYGQPYAVLDGNVARVLARLSGVRGDVRELSRWRKFESAAQQLMASVQKPGEWNQAMMELGALVCTPRAPRCGECPVAAFCRARRFGVQEEIPAKRKKRATRRIRVAAAVLLDAQGRTLLVPPQAKHANLFSGMWQFPAVEVKNKDSPQSALRTQGIFDCNPLDQSSTNIEALPAVRHSVTFRDITLLPVLVRVAALPRNHGTRAVRLAAVDSIPVSNATRKIAQAALAGLSH